MPRKPKTGKKTKAAARSARLANAYREGMRTHSVVALFEDREAYDRLLRDLRGHFQPRTPFEETLVEQAADATWRSRRLKSREFALLSADKIDTAELNCICRWQTRIESSYRKACNELKRLLKLRAGVTTSAAAGPDPAPKVEESVYWWDPITNERLN